MTVVIDPTRLRHECIRASAGSGKTFQLTSRYLALLAAGAPIGSVLATTFTRLAAGEIRDRVLVRLAEAGEDDARRDELEQAIGATGLDRSAVFGMLRAITRDLHRVQIRTLDSFFGSIVRCFAVELGIPPNAGIADAPQEAAMRAEALRLMLDEGDPQRFVELLRLLTQGTSDRSVINVLDRTVQDLLDVYRQAAPDAWDSIAPRSELGAAQLVDAVQHLHDTPPNENGHHIKAHAKDCGRARAEQWTDFLSKGLAGKILNEDGVFHGRAVPADVAAAYEPVIDHACAVLVNQLRHQTLATRDLLAQFDRHHLAVKYIAGLITFADVTAAMGRAEPIGRQEEIGYRIDATIQHLLLDEFQDTSVPQWQALEPIARELVSDETRARTFFCVGDVKQSIYGWRDACPEVLDETPNLLRAADGEAVIHESRLSSSFRSSPVVIDVVNTVFEAMTDNPALGEFHGAAEAFEESYQRHDTVKKTLPGHVALRSAPQAEGSQKQEAVRLKAAANWVSELHATAPHATIGVLTRTNSAVARLLYEFGPTRLNLQASGRGGGPLTSAPAVNVLLDAIRLADHPNDSASAFSVANSPLGTIVGLARDDPPAHRRETARVIRRRLLDEGYAGLLQSWLPHLAPSCDEREYDRLLKLLELAAAYDHRASLRPADFVRVVESVQVAQVRAAPIEVMTIHQAKGLEFDIVVLPELDKRLVGSGSLSVVIERANVAGPIVRVCRWVNKETRAAIPELEPIFERHRQRTVRESLCLLYVALTRAKQGLYMLIDPAAPNERTHPKTLAGILRGALCDHQPEPDATLFSAGDATHLATAGGATAPSTLPITPDAITLPEPRGQGVRGRAALSASGRAQASGTRRATSRYLSLPDEAARDRGVALHRLFESIEWLDDQALDRDELVATTVRVAARRGIAWVQSLVDEFLRMTRQPAVRALLTRTASPGVSVCVHRELPFARLVDHGVQRGYIDRLVLESDGAGKPVRATVIDFKTDNVVSAEAEAHADQYRAQLHTYRDAVHELFGVPVALCRLQLLFVTCDAVIDLESG